MHVKRNNTPRVSLEPRRERCPFPDIRNERGLKIYRRRRRRRTRHRVSDIKYGAVE